MIDDYIEVELRLERQDNKEERKRGVEYAKRKWCHSWRNRTGHKRQKACKFRRNYLPHPQEEEAIEDDGTNTR